MRPRATAPHPLLPHPTRNHEVCPHICYCIHVECTRHMLGCCSISARHTCSCACRQTVFFADLEKQSMMCYSHRALYKSRCCIFHAEHFQSMFAVCRQVLPHAFHLGLPGHGTTKIFVSVAPEKIGLTPGWLQSSNQRCIFGFGRQSLPWPKNIQRA